MVHDIGTSSGAALTVERPSKHRLHQAWPYLLMSAALVVVVATNVIPIIFTLWQSVHRNVSISQDHSFIGIDNYTRVLKDPAFIRSFVNTISYTVITIVLVLLLGLLFASWLRGVRHGKAVLLTIIILPWAVPGTVNGSMWSLILNPSSGFLNGTLRSLGLISHDIQWLQGEWAIPVVSLTLVWQALPIGTLILLSGLESIPGSLYEQGRVDGAVGANAFFRITLPLLRPVIAICTVQTAFTAVNVFDQIYVLNGNAGNTISIVQQTYVYAFKALNFGMAFSASIISMLITVVIALVVVPLVYREVEFT